MSAWPRSMAYTTRFRVPDLVPDRLPPHRFRAIFIGESPHRDEVMPLAPDERTPFRGMAGREWWMALNGFLTEPQMDRKVQDRSQLLRICEELRIAVMNAVQFPIDPKIEIHQGPESAPYERLGFQKSTGALGYKAIAKLAGSDNPVQDAITDLASRLERFDRASLQIVCLGGDSQWFVERALKAMKWAIDPVTIPHPSSWWRSRANRQKALDYLAKTLSG